MNPAPAVCLPCGVARDVWRDAQGSAPTPLAALSACPVCRSPLSFPRFPRHAPAIERCALSTAEYIASQRLVEQALGA